MAGRTSSARSEPPTPAELAACVKAGTLQSLDLKHLGGDAGLEGPGGRRDVVRLLRLLAPDRCVMSLDLWGVLPSASLAPSRVWTTLCATLRENTALCVLDVGANALGDVAASELVDALLGGGLATNLQRLVLSQNALSDGFGASAARLIRDAACLQHLELKGNQLANGAAAAISAAVSTNHALQSLSLGRNSIGAKGATALAKALRSNHTLCQLELKHNLLEPRGLDSLLREMKERCHANLRRATVAASSSAARGSRCDGMPCAVARNQEAWTALKCRGRGWVGQGHSSIPPCTAD
jgi:hypothetical protein